MRLAAKLEPNPIKIRMLLDLGWKNFEIHTNRSYITSGATSTWLAEFQSQVRYVVHAPTTYFDFSVIDFAYRIGAKIVNTHKIVSNERLCQLVEYANEKGIIITVENESLPESHHLDKHENPIPTIKVYDPLRSVGDFRRLKEDVPGIKLCVNVEHAIIRREYPEFIQSCCNNLAHVYINGFSGGAHRIPVYENISLVKEVVEILRACQYKGFVVCEHDVEFCTIDVWERTLKECGPMFDEENK